MSLESPCRIFFSLVLFPREGCVFNLFVWHLTCLLVPQGKFFPCKLQQCETQCSQTYFVRGGVVTSPYDDQGVLLLLLSAMLGSRFFTARFAYQARRGRVIITHILCSPIKTRPLPHEFALRPFGKFHSSSCPYLSQRTIQRALSVLCSQCTDNPI